MARPGDGCVGKWKDRLPLHAAMAGAVDGRAISAAKKAVKRMSESPDESTRSESTLLNNYMKLVATAQSMQSD
eukprot:7940918-Pyramimonas_sp.AAC.1